MYVIINGCFQPTASMWWNPQHLAHFLRNSNGKSHASVTWCLAGGGLTFWLHGHEMVPGSISRAAPSRLLSGEWLHSFVWKWGITPSHVQSRLFQSGQWWFANESWGSLIFTGQTKPKKRYVQRCHGWLPGMPLWKLISRSCHTALPNILQSSHVITLDLPSGNLT